MAKTKRFPLRMKNGAEVMTLEALRAQFDPQSVLAYFADGSLKTWLSDRYYDRKAEAVGALSADMPGLTEKLCEILGAADQTDETAREQRRNEKLRKLKVMTDDSRVLAEPDLAAFSQEELFEILDEDPERVYLCGAWFSVPSGKRNVRYIGVNAPCAELETNEDVYRAAGICFEGVRIYAENPCDAEPAPDTREMQKPDDSEFSFIFSIRNAFCIDTEAKIVRITGMAEKGKISCGDTVEIIHDSFRGVFAEIISISFPNGKEQTYAETGDQAELLVRADDVSFCNILLGMRAVSVPACGEQDALLAEEPLPDDIAGTDPAVRITDIVDSCIHNIPQKSNTATAYDSHEIENVPTKTANAAAKWKQAAGRIIGLVDTSLFGNGKAGLLFTTEGIGFEYALERIFIRWDEITNVEISTNEKDMYLGGFFRGIKNPECTPSISNIFFRLPVLKEMIGRIIRIV